MDYDQNNHVSTAINAVQSHKALDFCEVERTCRMTEAIELLMGFSLKRAFHLRTHDNESTLLNLLNCPVYLNLKPPNKMQIISRAQGTPPKSPHKAPLSSPPADHTANTPPSTDPTSTTPISLPKTGTIRSSNSPVQKATRSFPTKQEQHPASPS